MQRVAESDVVFVASGSESILIHGDDLRDMPRASESVGCMRRFFDISVPRNVASDVSEVEGSHVFNVDDLKEVSCRPLSHSFDLSLPLQIYIALLFLIRHCEPEPYWACLYSIRSLCKFRNGRRISI